jgi:beta-mannosidase
MPRRITDLTPAGWRLGQAPVDSAPDAARWQELERVREWLPATVPGNVRADLIRAGRLPELTSASAVEASRWVEDTSWWLVRDLSLSLAPGERALLVLRGVDYISDLFLNGHHLGRHEGMFSPQEYEVTELLQAENRLAVRITGSRWLPTGRSSAWEKLLNRVEARFGGLARCYPHRRDTVKCQMGFGWDLAPPLRTMGIWDDVYAVVSGEVYIRHVQARQEWSDDRVALAVQIDLDARKTCRPTVRCSLTGETFQGDPVTVERAIELAPGTGTCTLEMQLVAPRLWWPWDHGRPHLYRLTVEAWDGDRFLDSTSQRIGLRQLALHDWVLHVNGQQVYARGANWVPADVLPGRVGPDDYHELLNMARQGNMNMIRVWGGGLREKRSFYDLCDRLGILVWQELPFACAFLTRYPRSPEYLHLAATESQAIVRDLRAHPSLAIWCGGNEFSPARNQPLVNALRQAVAAADPGRPFLPASPSNCDSHNWHVWHDWAPASAYLDDEAAFASEFGLQAPPSVATLRRIIPHQDLWPPGPSWSYHGAGLAKLWRYARPFLRRQPDLETFVDASQQAQAYGLQIAIEHYRRRKAQGCGGVLVWQLNEPWPAVSWSLIGFFRDPKPAYETVRRLFRPVLTSIEFRPQRYEPGGRFQGRVWIVNDLAELLHGCHLQVTLRNGEGQAVYRLDRTLDVPAGSAGVVDTVDWTLPDGRGWQVTCRLTGQGQNLSENAYDLTVYDDIQPPFTRALWGRIKNHLLQA